MVAQVSAQRWNEHNIAQEGQADANNKRDERWAQTHQTAAGHKKTDTQQKTGLAVMGIRHRRQERTKDAQEKIESTVPTPMRRGQPPDHEQKQAGRDRPSGSWC